MAAFITDFGAVKLSRKTSDFLDKNAPDWKTLILTKPKGKLQKRQKQIIEKVFAACVMRAWIEWADGGVLDEF